MLKMYFRPGLRRSPDPWSDTHPRVSSLSTLSASRSRRMQNEVVIGPRDNGVPGPVVPGSRRACCLYIVHCVVVVVVVVAAAAAAVRWRCVFASDPQ